MSAPALTSDQNILPVQAYFNLDGSFNTFIGQGHPFVVSATESIGINNVTTNATFYPVFSPVSSGQVTSLDVFTGLTYNPSTGLLTTTALQGNLKGIADLATNLVGSYTNALVYQSTNNTTSFIANGTTGQYLSANTSGAPTWVTPTFAGSTVTDDTSTNATRYPLFSSITSGNLLTEYTSSTKYQFNPNTGALTATSFVGSGASLTSIPNGALVNSSITVGTTAISLGSSSTTLAGLSSVTSTSFVGALTGNASSATTATSATVALNVQVTDSTSSSSTFYPTLSPGTTGSTNYALNTSSIKLSFVPNTGTLTTTALVSTGGSIDNTVIGGTTPSTGAFTTITGQTETLKGTGENLFLQSSNLTSASWVLSNLTNTGSQTDVFNGNTASLLVPTTTNIYPHAFYQNFTNIIGSTYTVTVYAKANGYTGLQLGVNPGNSACFDLTGVSSPVFASPFLSATQTLVNGWYKCVVTINSSAFGVFQFAINQSFNSNPNSYPAYSGNGTSGIYFCAPQIEIGTVSNTYIPTTSSQVYGTPTLSFSGVSTIGLQNDGSLFVQPAGTGALQAQPSTGVASTGGNARGANAVDWQTSRTAATMVASAQAVISGGQNNTASGTASSALGGYTNLVNANYATAVGGSYGTTRGVIGLVSIPASNQPLNVTTAGSTQSSMLVIGAQTTNATATALKSNTSAASATNQLVLPNGQTSTVSVYTFRALISAHNTATTDAAGWEIKGVISRGAAAANTALVGTPSVALLGATSGAISAGWGVVGAVAAVADTTNGALQIQVTGAASTTINWSATIETNELGY